MKEKNVLFASYGTTVFEAMSRLAVEYGTINLGQGFPDEEGPESLFDALTAATRDYPNQYPPMLGVPELRQAVARHNKRFYDIGVDWASEVMVASGATEALAAAILALLNPGDEVVLFEPLYDCYLPMIERAGATARIVRLEPPHWTVSLTALEEAFSEHTKLLLINNPMNPTGKVFSAEELEAIAQLVVRYDAYAICDEVYEHLVFDGREHLPLMRFPGMRDRCVRIGSAGKTFSMTGWKVGYVTGDASILSTISKAHQFLVFTTPPNLQRAVAHGLDNEERWYTGLAPALAEKRDLMHRELSAIGFDVLPCDSTYFMNADFRPLGFDGDDVQFCRHLTVEAGVTVVPLSALYAENGDQHLVRFCFCKRFPVLESALERLAVHFA